MPIKIVIILLLSVVGCVMSTNSYAAGGFVSKPEGDSSKGSETRDKN